MHHRPRASLIALATLAGLLTATAPTALAQETAPLAPLTYDPSISLAPLVERLGPAVVNLDISQRVAANRLAPWLSSGDEQHSLRTGQGSGFIISADGYILTNNHVVADADEVTVRLSDDRSFLARVIGTDERTDIALVKIDADEELPWVPLGDSEALRVGDRVVAIGNPLGLAHTVTEGIVSAKGRAIGAGPYDDFIQTDASINPGNSGGPLFNLRGEVVGINTAISRMGQGIGFAVPAHIAGGVLEELKRDGRVARGWIGVGLQELDPSMAERLKVAPGTGVVLRQVYPDSPADKAGLKAGDVVIAIEGEPVTDSTGLVRRVGDHKPGERVELGISRMGKKRSVGVELGERPGEKQLARGQRGAAPDGHDQQQSQSGAGKLGIRVRAAKSTETGEAAGLMVTSVHAGGAAEGRLRPGDRITECNQQEVSTVEELKKALSRDDEGAVFVVQRRGAQLLVEVRYDS